jgi:two-component system, cell cycle response regulator
MASRLSPPVRVLLLGAVPGIALTGLFRAGAIGGSAFQAGLTALFLLGTGLVLARGALRSSSRRGWITLGLALVAGMTGNALTGWAELGLDVPELVGIALGAGAFVLSVAGLAFMLADRPSRLPLGAALDGMTGALVAQAVVAAVLFSPVRGALQDGFDVVVLLYPLADVLLMGLVAAAVAHGGWRLDFWAVSLAGLLAITIGDSSALATSIVGDHVQGGAADLGWLAGTWLLAVAAWSPAPRRTPERWVRSAVPVVLGTVALAIVVVIAFSPHPLIPALACASGALAVVVGRLAITLHDNDRMLSVARTDSVTDALTGLGNRRQLMMDLEDEVERATEASPAALALFDLNGFKDYNDTYGHPAGDALLTSLGSDLAGSVDGIGSAYRMGGDEFCVLIHAGATDHHAIADRAAESLSAAARGFTVTAAHGVVLLPGEAATASDALRRADVRMYEHKAGSRVGSRRQVTQTLMVALEERDRALHGHGEGAQELASCIARRLGLSATDADAVRLGALLHDVGKLAIPDRILEKPGPLDPLEWEFMRSHTLIGQRILEGAPALRDVAALVRASHEHFDGNGYPDGLRGVDIPAGARIIAVCDAFDAMTRTRPHRPAMSAEAALAELHRCAGSQFDPAVVHAFAEAHEAHASLHAGPLAA